MKKLWIFFILFCIFACSDKSTGEDYPVIDVVNNVGKYQRVYCSDYFSSIELIPLETSEDCLLEKVASTAHDNKNIIVNEDYILMTTRQRGLYAFDHSGKFLHQIGNRGQGPNEYLRLFNVFLNTNETTIFIEDFHKILEYNLRGNFIRSFQNPNVEDNIVNRCSYVEDNVFVGQINISSGKCKCRYFLFNGKGETIKCFPNYTFFERNGFSYSNFDGALLPIRVDDRIYLKDYVNDTIYSLENLTLQPAYILGLGKYTFPKECLEISISNGGQSPTSKALTIFSMMGSANYFFYIINVPDFFPRPKTKTLYLPLRGEYTLENRVFGIYSIAENKNILLDTDDYYQTGIINDMNGGLPFFPRYYAGDNVVVDVWYADDMKEMLTEEYFAKQTVKDHEAHKKLRELMKNLKEDDNPVVVVAKLK